MTLDLSANAAEDLSGIHANDVCVKVDDHRTGQPFDLQRSGSGWAGTLSLPADLPEGWFFMGVFGYRCSTGAALSNVYTRGGPGNLEAGYGYRYYAYDHSPPTGSIVAPQSGQLYVANVNAGPSNDGTTTVLGTVHVETEAFDSAVSVG